MIIRVWGEVNSEVVEFKPMEDRKDYWYGYANKVPGLQDISIWAESSTGAIGHLDCQVLVIYNTPTTAMLVLAPYKVSLISPISVTVLDKSYKPRYLYSRGC